MAVASPFSSNKWSNSILCIFALKELVVGIIHGFKADGGVESIAGYPLSTSGCADEMLFAINFLSEKNVLVFMFVLVISLRASDLTQYTIAVLTGNHIHQRLMLAYRPGLIDRLLPNAPGRHNIWAVPLILIVALLVYLYERKPKSSESALQESFLKQKRSM
ncbi:unnamed protein product [Symbiodinium sp. CCMP2456]|nr:unnamed protein product [Symbiodinium sp. CCMP2456]